MTDNLPERQEAFIDAEVVYEPFWDDVVSPVTGRPMHFDREGNPISMRRWGELRETGLDPDGRFSEGSYVRVGYDEIDDSCYVSTVWLGMDHGFPWRGEPDYEPVIFETMVFGGEYDQYTMRYTSQESAELGHQAVVVALRNGLMLESADE